MVDYIIFFTVLMAVFKPEIINILNLSQADNLLNAVLVFDLCILVYKLKGKLRKRSGKYVLWAVVFWLVCLIPTIIYFQNIRGIIVLMLKTVLLGLVCYYSRNSYQRFRKLIIVSALVFSCQIILNLLFIKILPYGSFTAPAYNLAGELVYNYFLGPKNNFTTFALTGVLMVALFEEEFKNRIGVISYVYIILCIYSMYLVKCSIGLFLLVIVVAILILRLNKIFSRRSNKNLLVMCIGLVIFAAIAISIVLSEDFMQQITHSRWLIWVQAVKLFVRKPIFGYGMQLEHDLIYLYGTYRYSHNEILEIVLYGGIIALSIYIYIIKNIFMDVNILDKKYKQLFYVYIILYFMAQMVEAKFTALYIFFVIFIYSSMCELNISNSIGLDGRKFSIIRKI